MSAVEVEVAPAAMRCRLPYPPLRRRLWEVTPERHRMLRLSWRKLPRVLLRQASPVARLGRCPWVHPPWDPANQRKRIQRTVVPEGALRGWQLLPQALPLRERMTPAAKHRGPLLFPRWVGI